MSTHWLSHLAQPLGVVSPTNTLSGFTPFPIAAAPSAQPQTQTKKNQQPPRSSAIATYTLVIPSSTAPWSRKPCQQAPLITPSRLLPPVHCVPVTPPRSLCRRHSLPITASPSLPSDHSLLLSPSCSVLHARPFLLGPSRLRPPGYPSRPFPSATPQSHDENNNQNTSPLKTFPYFVCEQRNNLGPIPHPMLSVITKNIITYITCHIRVPTREADVPQQGNQKRWVQ